MFMKPVVVVIHGLGRTRASMLAIACVARLRGYRVVNWRYASTRGPIEEHAERFARTVGPKLAGAPRVDFVTHSLGGIIVRQFLAAHPIPNAGRVVMLAPPNRGSEVADVLGRNAILRRIVRPLGELGTSSTCTPIRLPRPNVEVGVIAGDRSHIPLFAHWMHDVPNDGVVPVERTRLEGMRAHLVLRRTHTFLPFAPDAIAQAFHFLACGRFSTASR
jgi:triacylglycerol lipase